MLEEKDKVYQPQVTHLLLYRQYSTYQALLEIHPRVDMSAEECFSKVVLYIMDWFKKRIGIEAIEAFDELHFLKEDYVVPTEYKSFDISKVGDINGLSILDIKTAYIEDKYAWVFRLVEPDNGREERDIKGRVFTTKISAYKREKSVVLGIKESCKEPQDFAEDAAGFRPGFVRAMFMDPELLITEAGLSPEYAFAKEPIHVNGKSKTECEKIYKELINSENRQMPILFVPGDFYVSEAGGEHVNDKTESLLGYCHVVVWDKAHNKLFKNNMKEEELTDVAGEGQIILYRNSPALGSKYQPNYYDPYDEGVLDEIKVAVKKEPLRKQWDFKKYYFSAPWWRTEKEFYLVDNMEDDMHQSDNEKLLMEKIADLKGQVENLERDNDGLQRTKNALEVENRNLQNELLSASLATMRANREKEGINSQYTKLKEEKKRLEASKIFFEKAYIGASEEAKEKYKPLLHFPEFKKGSKDEILSWIDDYYSETIVVHDQARDAFKKENRPIDWRFFCMMIHYLCGYTIHRNNGGLPWEDDVARDYDPERYGFKVTPTGSGPNSATKQNNRYKINIKSINNKKQDVILDMHLKVGKGRDFNMIRIYFYYDDEIKKSIIGFMPGHLPTVKDPH